MMFLARVVPTLLAASSLANALSVSVRGSDVFSEFVAALKDGGVSTAAEAYKDNADTDQGKKFIDLLNSGKELTVLASENSAFDSDHSKIDLDVLYLYNTIYGSIDKGFKTPGSSVTRRAAQSHSNSPSAFPRRSSNPSRKRGGGSLEDNQVQTIDQFSAGGSRKRWPGEPLILIDRTVGSAKVVSRFTFKKIIILIIDSVLKLPGTVSDALCKPLISTTPNGFTKFGGALQKAGLLDEVDTRDKITIFAPVDDSCGDFDNLSGDDRSSLLKNHFFFGKVVFGTLFPSTPSATAESGKEIKMSYENDVHYVSCGDTKAMVMRADVATANGVLHVIDRPLKCY